MRAKYYLMGLLVLMMGVVCSGQEAEQVFEEIDYQTPEIEFVDAELRPELFVFKTYQFSKAPICVVEINIENVYYIIEGAARNFSRTHSGVIGEILKTETAKKLSKEQLVFIEEAAGVVFRAGNRGRRKRQGHNNKFNNVLPIIKDDDANIYFVYGVSKKDAKVMAEALLEFLAERAEQSYNAVVKERLTVLDEIAKLKEKKSESEQKGIEAKKRLDGLDVYYTSTDEATEIIIGLNKQINDLDIETVGLRTKSEITNKQIMELERQSGQHTSLIKTYTQESQKAGDEYQKKDLSSDVKRTLEQKMESLGLQVNRLNERIKSTKKIIDKLEEQRIDLSVELAVLDGKTMRANEIRGAASEYIRLNKEIGRLRSSNKSFKGQLSNHRHSLKKIEERLAQPGPEMRAPEVVDGKGYVYTITK